MAVVETTIEVRSQQRSAVIDVGWYALKMASTLATVLVLRASHRCPTSPAMQNHKSESDVLMNGLGRREVLCALNVSIVLS